MHQGAPHAKQEPNAEQIYLSQDENLGKEYMAYELHFQPCTQVKDFGLEMCVTTDLVSIGFLYGIGCACRRGYKYGTRQGQLHLPPLSMGL